MQTLPRDNKDAVSAIDACQGTALLKIIQKARFLLALDQRVQTLLPAALASHCRVMNTHDTILVIGGDSAAIIMQLRFLSADLLGKLRLDARFNGIKEIHYRMLCF